LASLGKNPELLRTGALAFMAPMTAAEPFREKSAQPVQSCHCGQPMKLIKTVPRIASFPELRTFRCQKCGHVETVEVKS
jgi:hypothetical protein